MAEVRDQQTDEEGAPDFGVGGAAEDEGFAEREAEVEVAELGEGDGGGERDGEEFGRGCRVSVGEVDRGGECGVEGADEGDEGLDVEEEGGVVKGEGGGEGHGAGCWARHPGLVLTLRRCVRWSRGRQSCDEQMLR